MADKLILEIFVELEPGKTMELTSPAGKVVMLPFTGTAKGEIFHGVIAPGGVDTQVTNRAGARNMSARYMLVGEDREGKPCRIYVDNEGWFTAAPLPRPFVTVPTFLTDSPTLAPYLHRNQFRGEGTIEETGPVIRIYEVEE